jgi:hypothetical protein
MNDFMSTNVVLTTKWSFQSTMSSFYTRQPSLSLRKSERGRLLVSRSLIDKYNKQH